MDRMRGEFANLVRQFDEASAKQSHGFEEQRNRSAELTKRLKEADKKSDERPFGLSDARLDELIQASDRTQSVLKEEAAKFIESNRPLGDQDELHCNEALRRALATSAPDELRARLMQQIPHLHPLPPPPMPPEPGSNQEQAPILIQIYPPALSATPPSGSVSSIANAANGTSFGCVAAERQGGPLGLEAHVEPAWDHAKVRFAFVPPYSGVLHVCAEVWVHTIGWIVSTDHWYCHSVATGRVNLGIDIFQYAPSSGPRISIVDERREDSAYAEPRDATYYPTARLRQCEGNKPVLIDVNWGVQVMAVSNYASATICGGIWVKRLAIGLVPYPRVDVWY